MTIATKGTQTQPQDDFKHVKEGFKKSTQNVIGDDVILCTAIVGAMTTPDFATSALNQFGASGVGGMVVEATRQLKNLLSFDDTVSPKIPKI